MHPAEAAFLVLAGLACGAFLTWLALRPRARFAAEQARLAAQAERAALDERLRGLEAELRDTQAEKAALAGQLDAARADTAAARVKAAEGEARLEAERAGFAQRLAELQQARDRLAQEFKALAGEALNRNNAAFLSLAQQNFAALKAASDGDLAQRQEAIRTLVEPLRQQLDQYQQRLQQGETAQARTLGEVRQQLDALTQHSQVLAHETQQFRMVLKSAPVRGRWGEETLRRVVEAAGLSAHCDFVEQAQQGDAKPDLIVRLPGDRAIIVDAKVPDLDFLTALDAADPAARQQALTAHAQKLRGTIKALADRDYPAQFANALDHVVLFVPAESLFSAALEADAELIVWAAQRKILLATPASLIALLRSVAVSWQQHAQTENARAIAEAAQRLYERVATFGEHFASIGGGLEKAVSAYNRAVGSFQSRVLPEGQKLAALGAVPAAVKELAAPDAVETALRLTAPPPA
jgi:DNA recombination protein RmuC